MTSASMSALVDEAIRMCKTEEAKLTESIRQCRDMLRSMKKPVKDKGETVVTSSVHFSHDEISLKERQEIDLLEQTLKKALKVRSSSSVLKKHDSDGNEKQPNHESKVCHKDIVKDEDRRKPQKSLTSSKAYKTQHQHGRLKSAAVHKAVYTQPVLVKKAPSTRPAVAGRRLATKADPVQISGVDAQKKSCQTGTLSNSSDREKTSLGPPSSEEMAFISKDELRTELSPPKEQWMPSPLLPLWSAQRTKMTRLLNKVLTQHSKPVPERTRFKERISSTFPENWPSGHSAAWRAELDALTQLGLDLTHCYHAELRSLQSLKACVPGRDPETSMERDYESLLMLEGLKSLMAEVIKRAERLKTVWDTKAKWWYEGILPLRNKGMWSDPEWPCLPPLLSYSSEAELIELTTLGLQIDQLRLEICLHQAMSDTLTNDLSSSGPTSASEVRGLYSLLVEGGTKFPALVVDSEPDPTWPK